jgi:putative ATPase
MYDKSGEEHYNLISALHKSVRNSDPDAALYWLARMFASGEDPLYLARRVVRMAVEDIGLAAPKRSTSASPPKKPSTSSAPPKAISPSPKPSSISASRPNRTPSTPPTAPCSPKSNTPARSPSPSILRNAPTRLMKELDYGKGYRYAHDEEGKVADMDCLPDSLKGRTYYHPTQEGREKLLAQRMEEIRRIRAGKR